MIDWSEFDMSGFGVAEIDPGAPVEMLVWIFRPGKNVRGTAFMAMVWSNQLNADGTVMYAGEKCTWERVKP